MSVKKIGVDYMAGVAINGSHITPTVGHVQYRIDKWIERYCAARDKDGNCISYGGEIWEYVGMGSVDAKITGTVSVPSSKIKIQGANVAKVGDQTTEMWEATIPTPPSGLKYTPEGKISDSGQGKIISGSSRANLQGQPIAIIGSQVETCLGTITTIQTGNTKMNLPE